jgi:phosphomevalonate kinase
VAVIATAPGKVMLAGEYAVLDGGRAIVACVDRRAIATVDLDALPEGGSDAPARREPSPFLRAAREVVAAAYGADAARGFDALTVDTSALHDGDRKLGLGSSAAATVAAIAAVAAASPRLDAAERANLTIDVGFHALRAHELAQGARGVAGSGADVIATASGGVIDFRRGAPAHTWTSSTLALPANLQLVFAWTAQPADTVALVAAVNAARARTPASVERALRSIADAADALAAARTADAAIAAIAAGGGAMRALAAATGVPLVPPAVTALAAALHLLGAAAKTTGAGGGDIVLVAAPAHVERNQLDAAIVQAGLCRLSLALDPTGVDIRRPPA